MRFDGSTVVVTGSGSGIGRATAVTIAELGGGVVLGDITCRRPRKQRRRYARRAIRPAPTVSTSPCPTASLRSPPPPSTRPVHP